MRHARDALQDFRYQAVIVVRDHATLADSARRIENMLADLSAHYNSVGCLADGRFAALGMSEEIMASYDAADFAGYAGRDVADVLALIKSSFSSVPTIDIRCTDGANVLAHIDSGHEYETADDNLAKIFSCSSSLPPMPGGVTLTMSLCGGGSVLKEISPGDVRRVRGDNGGMVWELRLTEEQINDEEGWQVCDGDICLMRAADWLETHLPSLHSSPERSRPDDPRERLVSVAFL